MLNNIIALWKYFKTFHFSFPIIGELKKDIYENFL